MGLVKAFYGHEPLTLVCADGTTIRVYPHETEPIAHGRRGPGLRVLVDAPESVRIVRFATAEPTATFDSLPG